MNALSLVPVHPQLSSKELPTIALAGFPHPFMTCSRAHTRISDPIRVSVFWGSPFGKEAFTEIEYACKGGLDFSLNHSLTYDKNRYHQHLKSHKWAMETA